MGLVKRIKYTISAIKLIPYKILYGNRLNTGKQINLGSKTKIVVTKCGKIEIANGGTLFLDEIGDMPLHMQAKLLRVLQERQLMRVGGDKSISLDVRVISATHRNLEDMVKAGTFREDLYYRLNVVNIKLPSLSDRIEDVPLFVKLFIEEFCRENHIDRKSVV